MPRICLVKNVCKWFNLSGAEHLPINSVPQYAKTTDPDSSEKNMT